MGMVVEKDRSCGKFVRRGGKRRRGMVEVYGVVERGDRSMLLMGTGTSE
jgi:hypothetical protein